MSTSLPFRKQDIVHMAFYWRKRKQSNFRHFSVNVIGLDIPETETVHAHVWIRTEDPQQIGHAPSVGSKVWISLSLSPSLSLSSSFFFPHNLSIPPFLSSQFSFPLLPLSWKQRERETERQRDRQTDRQRQRYRQTDRQTDRDRRAVGLSGSLKKGREGAGTGRGTKTSCSSPRRSWEKNYRFCSLFCRRFVWSVLLSSSESGWQLHRSSHATFAVVIITDISMAHDP